MNKSRVASDGTFGVPARFLASSPALRARVGAGVVATLAFASAGAGCDKKEPELAQACCTQPDIPAGVTPFRVMRDDVTGRSDEQKVLLRAGLTQPIRRDAVYPVLHHLYRYVTNRRALAPIEVEIDLYPDPASADAGGDTKMIARIARSTSEEGPRCDNRVAYDLPEQVERAFNLRPGDNGEGGGEKIDDTCRLAPPKQTARFDAQFVHKSSYKLDAASRSVEVTYPYLELGKDEWQKGLTFSSAVMAWTEVAARFFDNVPDLRAVTFVGLLEDAPVVKIALSRQEFDASNRGLRETIAAHRGITFQSVGLRRMNDQQAAKEEQAFRTKTYKEALAKLSRSQVSISPKLK
jgi:hypothetical protein